MTVAEQAYSPAMEVAERHRENLIEADDLLKEIVQAGRSPTFAELTFFQRECGWNEIAINGQMRRMNSVLRFQAIAGSPEDRAAALKESETAAAIHSKESQKLDEQIQKLQAKRDSLERDSRLSQKRCQEQTDAVQQLLELCPEHIAKSVQHNVTAIQNSLGREVGDSEIRIVELQCCLTPSLYKNEQTYLETVQRSFRDAVVIGPGTGWITRKLSPSWPGIRVAIETELAELQAKLVELKARYAEAIEQAERPLSYYTN